MSQARTGNALAALSFVLWGILPLYYHFLPQANMNELLAIRIITSVPVMLLLIRLLSRKPMPLTAVVADRRSLGLCLLASLLMCVSWYSFTYALTHGQVLAASLGFFINPLVAIALGVFFLSDRLSPAQCIAVVLATLGIGYQVYQYGELPWISLLMGCFFALYGLVKKYIRYDSLTSVAVEAVLLTPPALAFLLYAQATSGLSSLGGSTSTLLLYLGAGPITLAPLILFTLAINRTSLTMVGLMQYIEPSLQFLLATVLFAEVFDQVKAVTFGLIWLGLLLCSVEALTQQRRKRRLHP
ncbi:EamA family transporter RarD [Ferrimonas sp. SCSIO 43195]|uniref:EamA family transporter RarD n=1 Tax=Ferrimonas sp. SCSIO 43195 TaxID=2822844 RepID=UPI002074E494|nr:EamA family transporter RarD [Ferrimonas sp. SCSIO 43195]USD38785.1 EamA family transporter RarD [Ferrimonas sp. SCSIO 43195]